MSQPKYLRNLLESSTESSTRSPPVVDSTPHSGINSDQLRLLQPILRYSDSLHFSVSTVLRFNAPPYTAVSYTWGDDDATETIYLDGEPFQVRPNLWSCLYRLVHSGKSHLWVDAICINQSDTEEKSAQVRCMDQTYKNASCVAVWLGSISSPPNSSSQHVIKSSTIMQDEEFLGRHELISKLTNRPYWSRVWVIQEFFLARDVEIWYGNSVLSIDHFQDLVLEHAGVHLSEVQHIDYTPSKSPHRAWSFITNRDPSRYPDSALPLWRLLIDQRHSICKDPRDKVFAFLGLLPKDEKDLLGRFFPNYDISEDHVIIITLVHLQEYSLDCPKITLNSDDVFLGLGVDDESRRRKLLRQAADIEFDYFHTLKGNPLHT